jgi:hypothetical protein
MVMLSKLPVSAIVTLLPSPAHLRFPISIHSILANENVPVAPTLYVRPQSMHSATSYGNRTPTARP